MAYSAKQVFDFSIQRCEHYLSLYDILHDSRRRRGRKDWKSKFKKLMHWPASQSFYRMDGRDSNSILIIKEDAGLTPDKFQHDYVSELLRSAITTSVSAMDRYFHDLIVENTVGFLGKADRDMPKKFKQLNIPILASKKALEKIRENPTSRPNTIIKKEVQKILHKEHTFQSPSNLLEASKILGIEDFWGKVASEISPSMAKGEIIDRLRKINRRRNQIVHESDIILKTSAKAITLRDITKGEAEESCSFIKALVTAVDQIEI